MSFDPTEVRSRDELLMGAIATGDATLIGDPRDRNEEFIKAIAEGIGGSGTLYLHNISGNLVDMIHHSYRTYLTIINRDNTPINTLTALAANISNIVSVSGYNTSLRIFIVALETLGSNITGRRVTIEQDEDTKDITFESGVSTLSSISVTDTVVSL